MDNNIKKQKFSLLVKRTLDVIFAALLLVILSPMLVFISALIKIESSGPALFKQRRVGMNECVFEMYKYRTMIVDAENIGLGYNIMKNDPRITGVGNFLRNWSLDEIPQLINILRGEMSFIGPRPTLRHQVDAYTPHQRKRLLMKPGITGLAQVNGRNTIPWEQRIELDIWYVENWSLWLDFVIFIKTFRVILQRDAIYNQNEISYDFHGKNNNGIKK